MSKKSKAPDLFQSQPAAVQAGAPKTQYVRLHCECGAKAGAKLTHYDIVQCVCGRMFWALQPKRNGPLVAFPRILPAAMDLRTA